MASERIAERRIREAIQAGEFDNLPHGKRIDLDEYFKLPEALRMASSILKSAGCLPEEVALLNDVDRLESAIEAARDESTKAPLRKALAAARLQLDLALERRRVWQRAA